MFSEHPPGPDTSCHYADGPDAGPPIYLWHGVLRSWNDFAPLWPALLAQFRVRAFTHLGHGQSNRASSYRVIDYRRAFRVEPDAGDILYGHSLGALVAASIASGQHVRALILEDPPAASLLRNVRASSYFVLWSGMKRVAEAGASIPEMANQLAEIRVPASPTHQVRLGDVRDAVSLRFSAACLKQIDLPVFDSLLDGTWLEGYDQDSLWSKIACPTLILRGDPALGGMLDRAEADRLAGLMADCTVVDVAAGHLLHWQATQTVLNHVLGFLASLE